jgi:hypothetical protein
MRENPEFQIGEYLYPLKRKHEPKVARETRNLGEYKIETEAHPTERERERSVVLRTRRIRRWRQL